MTPAERDLLRADQAHKRAALRWVAVQEWKDANRWRLIVAALAIFGAGFWLGHFHA